MRGVMACLAAVLVGLSVGVPASADVSRPELVDRTEWASGAGPASLRVYPTALGRAAAGTVGTEAQGEQAWAEVLALTADADSPGMRDQFRCHWRYAEFARPGKTSWNLEPWRPVVDDAAMLDSGCNPGGPEEAR